MKLLPPHISTKTKSPAERRLFRHLEQSKLDDTYVCLHSLNLPEHQYKVCGELDFVIVCPRGIYVLEVKGGAVSCREGIWYYTDRSGTRHKRSEGPFQQASSGMFSLREKLLHRLNSRIVDELVFGYGVIFPDCDFDQRGVEWDQQTILDAKRLEQRGVDEYIRSLESYWHAKMGHKPVRVDDSTRMRSIVGELRPDFEMAYSLQMQASDIDLRLTKLTEEQYSRLDIVEHSPRLLVEGGAGTGKTFLAVEIARRHAAAGRKTLLICFSPLLANFIQKLNKEKGTAIFSVHGLMLDVIKKYGHLPEDYYPGRDLTDPWFVDVLVPAFETAARNINEEEKYQVLIIDEGQDVLNLDYMMALDNVLAGGLEKGIWRIFFDPHQQGALLGSVDKDVIDWLKQYGPVTPRLQVNCRNTDPIVLKTKLITGTDISGCSTGKGPEVTIEWYEDKLHCAHLIEEYLKSLIRQGIADPEITILSPQPLVESSVSLLSPKRKRQIRQLNGRIADTFPFSQITYSQIADFKGLENRYVLVVDLDDLYSSDRARAMMYVAMTRARVKLWMAIHHQNKSVYEQEYLENLSRVAGSTG